MAARNMRRPILPKPLIPRLTDISLTVLVGSLKVEKVENYYNKPIKHLINQESYVGMP